MARAKVWNEMKRCCTTYVEVNFTHSVLSENKNRNKVFLLKRGSFFFFVISTFPQHHERDAIVQQHSKLKLCLHIREFLNAFFVEITFPNYIFGLNENMYEISFFIFFLFFQRNANIEHSIAVEVCEFEFVFYWENEVGKYVIHF